MVRVLAKLDVKPPTVVKPVHYEGLRKIGTPEELAKKYYLQGADEILYVDIVASLYQREILYPYIEKTADEVYVPLAVGGGVRNLDDFSKLFHAGADKVVINTYALQEDCSIIEEAAKVFGSQSVVVNIEAKQKRNDWLCYSDCGRMISEWSVLDWAQKVSELGAGEILLQSVDTDGRKCGFDVDLVSEVVDRVNIPVIAASGAGTKEDVLQVIQQAGPSAVAVSSLLHYDLCTISELKTYLKDQGVEVNV